MKIPIIFGWLHFHRKEQWTVCESPTLVIHWYSSKWMSRFCDTHSKRILLIK